VHSESDQALESWGILSHGKLTALQFTEAEGKGGGGRKMPHQELNRRGKMILFHVHG
jgi:hypothetical protein